MQQDFASLMAPLGPFESAPRIAVAVSGGADSMALALLAREWAAAQGGEAVAVTVDHGLRAESAEEAARVGQWLDMDHAILHWHGPKPTADIQAQARIARYGLIQDWARERGILHVLLAHHREDQAETLLLRLGRGSGVDGLAAMAKVQEDFHMRWLRPLLDVPRAHLRAFLAERGQNWVEDPSNANSAFARVRLRRALEGEGLSPERLAGTAARLGRARAALEHFVADAAARYVRLDPAGFALVSPQAFAAPPEEVGLRLLSRLVMALGGGVYAPRLERTESLYYRLVRGLEGAATLGGCRVAPQGSHLLFTREAARMAPPVALVPNTEIAWDGRFRAVVAEDAPRGLTLGGLGIGGWRQVSGKHRLPAAARATLPTIYDEDGISAVPHLGYNRNPGGRPVLRWLGPAPAMTLTVAGRCLV